MIIAKHTLWETDDRKNLVPDLHPDARYLFCVPGDELDGTRESWYKDTLAEMEKPAEEEPVTETPEVKQIQAPAETKQVKAPQATKRGK